MASEPLRPIGEGCVNTEASPDEILIRMIGLGDAEAAARLSAELGYPAEPEEMIERIAHLNSSTGRVVYVACVSNVPVAWIDVAVIHHLSTGAFGEIGGLVVSSEHRGSGIGGRLIAHAERWVADQGVSRMVVRSRTSREAAHRFYLREGYSLTKTSAVFSKQLKF